MANEENNFENDDISRLLGSLRCVEAPGDFDVRVQAKIAQERPAGRRGWVTLQVAAAMLVILAAGYVGFRSFSSHADPAQPVQIAKQDVLPQPESKQIVDQSRPETADIPDAQSSDDKRPIASRPPAMNARMVNKTVAVHETKPVRKQIGGGSVDMASSFKEPLSKIGAEANTSGTVGEVKQNSVAERSGLKSGDVVVKVTKKSVHVRRDGKIVEIPLKP